MIFVLGLSVFLLASNVLGGDNVTETDYHACYDRLVDKITKMNGDFLTHEQGVDVGLECLTKFMSF